MLTWVIVKTRIDSSLKAYEHSVACDNENNCPAGPALRGQPCGAAYPRLPCFDLRCTPLVDSLVGGVKTPPSKGGVQPHLVSKDGQRTAHGAFLPAQMRP